MPEKGRLIRVVLFEWIPVGAFEVKASFSLDPLSAVMALVVTGVGTLIHLYSMGYMHDDRGVVRYFIYLNLFSLSMLTLVLGDNFVVMFVGWEAVGLCSYLLIGFWYERKAAAEAGKKAFIVNRVGDFCFLIALFYIYSVVGSLDYSEVFAKAPGCSVPRALRRRSSACCSSRAPRARARRFRFTSGCPTRWKAPPRSAP